MKNLTMVAFSVCAFMIGMGLMGCTPANVQQPDQRVATAINNLEFFTPTPAATLNPTIADCAGDIEPPSLRDGWRLQWQRTFEHPIARPPAINNAQLVILERAELSPDEVKDTISVMDPRTSTIQWRFEGVDNIATYSTRQVTDIQWSQKYLALNVLYTNMPSLPHTAAYVVVLDRLTGQVVYSAALNTVEMAIADDALYYRGSYRELHRIDLPDHAPRWEKLLAGGIGVPGLFLVGPRLYAFGSDQTIYQHNPLDGSLVATATLGATPIIGDVLIQDNLALVRSWYGYEGVVSFDLETFELKWATAVPYLIENRSNTFLHGIPTMAVTPDSVYLFDAQDNLLRINLLTGKIIWTAPSSGVQAMSRPAANHGLVYGLFADGTLRAFSEVDGSSIGVVMKVPLWYWRSTDTKEWRDLVGGLDIVDDTLIVTTGCHNVYAIQHEP